MARSPWFVGKQSGGKFIVKNEGFTTGNVFFVDSVTGTNGAGYGRQPEKPFATIAYAVAAATSPVTANNGDVVFVMPSHAEVLTAAAGIVFGVAGTNLIGLGNGSDRPTITMGTDAGVDIDIEAANVRIKGIDFYFAIADIVAAIDIDAHDFTIEDCNFYAEGAGLNALIVIQDAALGASDRITIQNCTLTDRDAANTHFVNFSGTGDGHIVRNNRLLCDCGTMAIGGAGVVTNCVCIDNVIDNAAADNDSCINFAAASTGICARNVACGGAAQANGFTATAMTIGENYYGVSAENLSAILDPPNA